MKLEPRPVSSLEPRLQANVSASRYARQRQHCTIFLHGSEKACGSSSKAPVQPGDGEDIQGKGNLTKVRAKPSSAYRQRVARAACEVPESLMLHGPMEGQPLKRQRNLDALRPSLESSTTVRGEVVRRNYSGILCRMPHDEDAKVPRTETRQRQHCSIFLHGSEKACGSPSKAPVQPGDGEDIQGKGNLTKAQPLFAETDTKVGAVPESAACGASPILCRKHFPNSAKWKKKILQLRKGEGGLACLQGVRRPRRLPRSLPPQEHPVLFKVIFEQMLFEL